MERTQSCSDFKENLPMTNNSPPTTNVVRTIEQQQQHQQQHHFKIKTDTVRMTTNTTNTTTTTTTSATSTSKNLSSYGANTTTTSQRKKRLQRQKSAVYSGDEAEYAADLEEEGDEEDEGYGPSSDRDINLPVVSAVSNQKKKQVRFRSKQQSESSLQIKGIPGLVPLDKTPSSSSLTSSLNSSGTMSSGSHERRLKSDGSFDSITELPQCHPSGNFLHQKGILKRDNSVHSDSSRYSSVDSLLEARKPDPEAILINLGFGPVGSEDILSRIPKRFLKPSQVRGIDTGAFIKRLQLANTLADHSVLGYRGLTGNPDIPPSHIVAKIMERFEVNERKKSLTSMELKLR